MERPLDLRNARLSYGSLYVIYPIATQSTHSAWASFREAPATFGLLARAGDRLTGRIRLVLARAYAAGEMGTELR
jgi:hypothetical protein